MARAVTADHILFSECMYYLRRDFHQEKPRFAIQEDQKTFSCVCTTFRITKEWNLGDFSIHPSRQYDLPSCKKSLISFVSNPSWIKGEPGVHSFLFGEVLSSLISFIALVPSKSPRNTHYLDVNSLDEISDKCIEDVAFTLPFIMYGTGASKTRLTTDEEDQIIRELRELIEILNNVDRKLYEVGIQAIRLIHLSILTKRDDFGLGYLLLISAIEAVAQKAINEKVFKETHPKEQDWTQKAKVDESFRELLKVYKEARNKDKHLSKRFTKFILDFCPPNDWEDLVRTDYDFSPREWSNMIKGTEHPSCMRREEIEKILNSAYKHRSFFVHRGEQPPHQNPQAGLNKFFEVIHKFDEIPFGEIQETTSPEFITVQSEVYPTYELMLGIAKHSIIRWLKTKIQK